MASAEIENQKYESESRKIELVPVRPSDGGPAVSKLQQAQAKGKEIAVEEEVCSSRAGGRSSDNKYKHLCSYPRKPGLKILRGWRAADLEGQSALRALEELRSIKKTLSDLRSEVERGIGRVAVVIESLEGGGLGQGDKELKLGGKESGKAVEEGPGPDGMLGADGPMKRNKKKKNLKKKKPEEGCVGSMPGPTIRHNREMGV